MTLKFKNSPIYKLYCELYYAIYASAVTQMPFNIEDQYQQYLYPESVGMNNMDSGANYNPAAYVVNEQGNPNTAKKIVSGGIQVLILNEPSKINKKLLKFFTSNIDLMNQNDMFFEWIVVYEDEMEQYEEQQITEFPTLIFKNEHIIGADAIIDYLMDSIPEEGLKNIQTGGGSSSRAGNLRRGRGKTSKPNEGGADAEIRNYFLRELDNRQEDDADEDDVFASTVTQRVAAMNKARQLNGQPTLKMSNPEIHERTARAASRQNKYKFNENAQDYNDSLQSAMSSARKQTERQRGGNPRARRSPADSDGLRGDSRDDNLNFPQHEEDDFRDDADEKVIESATSSTVDIVKSTSNGSMDDELMLRYWENNTELSEY